MAAIQFTEATKAYPRTIAPAGKYPIVGDRIYRTLQDAQDYVDGKSSSKSAIPGIYLSVIDDGINNGAYWVEQAAGYDGATVGVLRKMGAGGGGGGDISLAWDDITGKPSFAAVATSGSYNDLTDKPTIPSLDGYATQQWVSNQGFAVAASLGALAYKNGMSWSEVSGRPTKLSDFTNDAGFITSAALAGYLKEEDAETIYITEEEAENRYVKRGGDSINGDISFGGSIKIGGATLSWDEASHALKVDTSFYTEKQIASGGIGDASGSGLGLILNEWPTDSEDYSKYALGGNLGIELNTRLTAVEGKATNVTVSPTLSQGKPMGTIMVDGVSQTMYAPATYSADDILPTQERNFVSLQDIEYWNTAYLPLTGGTISANDQSPLSVKSTSGTSSYIRFESVMGTIGYIGIGGDRKPSFMTHDGTAYKLLHTGDVSGTLTGSLVPDTDGAYHLGSSSYRLGVVFALQGVFYGGLSINHESVATQTWVGNNYLKLSGGAMSDNASINWNGNTISWDSVPNGLVGISNLNSAYGYAAGLSFKGYYGLQVRSLGGKTDDIEVRGHDSSAWGTWLKVIHSGNYSSYALPLTGGTITGTLAVNSEYNFAITNNTTGAWSGVRFRMSGENKGYLGVDSTGKPIYVLSDQSAMYTLIHSGNIGSQSVASATKLETARTIWGQSFDGTGNVSGDLYLEKGIIRGKDNKSIIGADSMYNIDLGYGCSEGGGSTYIHGKQVALYRGTSHAIGLLLDSSGNVGIGTADPQYKLDVNGRARINGNLFGDSLTSRNSIYAGYSYDNGPYFGPGTDGTYWGAYTHSKGTWKATNAYFYPDGSVRFPNNVDIGVAFNGTPSSGKLKIGSAVLSWDSANNALKIEGNVYVTGQVAAGGVGTAN